MIQFDVIDPRGRPHHVAVFRVLHGWRGSGIAHFHAITLCGRAINIFEGLSNLRLQGYAQGQTCETCSRHRQELKGLATQILEVLDELEDELKEMRHGSRHKPGNR